MRITLSGGSCCGLNLHLSRDAHVAIVDGQIYLRTELRDAENRQIFAAIHSGTLASLTGCLGIR